MRMKIRYELVAMLLIWTVLWSMIAGISGRVKASPNTVVTLALQAEPPQVEVSPGSSGIVTMQGTVYCLKYGPDQVKVNLKGSSTAFGEVLVNPPNMVFGGNSGSEETRTFSITTRIPQGTTFSATPQITVSGHYIQGGIQYPITPESHFMEILPYYKIYVEAPRHKTIAPGERVSFHIQITNIGNTFDTYEFNFDNLRYLAKGRRVWQVATITPQGFLPKQTRTITVSAQKYESENEDFCKIFPFNLEIISQQSRDEGGNVKAFVPLYLRIKERFIPQLIPSLMLIGFIITTMVFAGMAWDKNTKERVRDTWNGIGEIQQ
jgi:hypothetical protein